MSNTTPFKLIIKDLDKSAQFDSNYPADSGIDSPLCRALYLQMVPTMCDQATIDEFFISLAKPTKEEFSALRSLVTPEDVSEGTVNLATYLLSTYQLIDTDGVADADEYARWFANALATIYGKKTECPVPDTNPIWNGAIAYVPTLPHSFAILGLFVNEFSPANVAKTIGDLIPLARHYSTPNMPENLMEQAKKKVFTTRIHVLAKIGMLCDGIFKDGTHIPDPATVATIVEDVKDRFSDEPKLPEWAEEKLPELDLPNPPEKSEEVVEKPAEQSKKAPIVKAEPAPTKQPAKVEPATVAEPPAKPSKEEPVADVPAKSSKVEPVTDVPAAEVPVQEEPKAEPLAEKEPPVDNVVAAEPEVAGSEEEPAESAQAADTEPEGEGDDLPDLSGIVTEDEPAESGNSEEAAPTSDAVDSFDKDIGDAADSDEPALGMKRPNIPQKVLMEIYLHASTPEQIKEAARLVEQDITSNSPNAQYLVRYVPGVTSEIIKDILTNRTASGKYVTRQLGGKGGDAIPHTNLTGGSTYTANSHSRTIGPVEVPPGFAQENSSVLWDEPVITTMGFPFINFGAPEIYTILKEKDESKVKKAYSRLKSQMKKVGLASPIKVLKDFKNAKGVRCALNRITVDAEELLGNGNRDVIASVYPRAGSTLKGSIGSVSLTRDFIVEMYKVLSPTKGARIYMDTLRMSEDEYADTLNRDGKPPLYIFIPKERLAFAKAPAGFIARLLTSNSKPTLVEARINNHFGGFVMPFKTSRLLFTEI